MPASIFDDCRGKFRPSLALAPTFQNVCCRRSTTSASRRGVEFSAGSALWLSIGLAQQSSWQKVSVLPQIAGAPQVQLPCVLMDKSAVALVKITLNGPAPISVALVSESALSWKHGHQDWEMFGPQMFSD